MTGYTFALTCPACGGELAHVAGGRPQAGTYASAIARCVECRLAVQVIAAVRAVDPRCTAMGKRRQSINESNGDESMKQCAPTHQEIPA